MANADVEAVGFEPEEDDLMDEGVDVETASPRVPQPKLKSTIPDGGNRNRAKPKGRGIRGETETELMTLMVVLVPENVNINTLMVLIYKESCSAETKIVPSILILTVKVNWPSHKFLLPPLSLINSPLSLLKFLCSLLSFPSSSSSVELIT